MRSLLVTAAASLLAVLSLASGALLTAPSRADELQQGGCGNYRCEPPEDCNTCPQDCGDCCGNRRCEPPEDCNTCPQDCGRCCGNRRCEPPEDSRSCPEDCG